MSRPKPTTTKAATSRRISPMSVRPKFWQNTSPANSATLRPRTLSVTSDHYWQETEPGAQAVAHELTRRQMNESAKAMIDAAQKLKNCGAQDILDNTSKAKAEQLMNKDQMEAYQEFLSAKAYQSFAVHRRDSKNITSTLKESHPMLEISPRDLDADCFLLCHSGGDL